MRLGGHIGKESISVRENTPNSDLWVISIGNALEISMRGDRFDELMSTAAAARGGSPVVFHVEGDLTAPEAEQARTSLAALYDTRPEGMSIPEWSAKVAAVVEAARAWAAPFEEDMPIAPVKRALLHAVRALDGES